jgi:hypothetical protein
MKKSVLIFIALTVVSIHAQSALEEHQLTATLKAVDDVGQPVTNAKVWVAYDMSTNLISGTTGTNGTFVASHFCRSIQLQII